MIVFVYWSDEVNFPISISISLYAVRPTPPRERVEMKPSARGSSHFLQVQRSLLLLIVFTVLLFTVVLGVRLSSITVKLPASHLSAEEEMELPAG